MTLEIKKLRLVVDMVFPYAFYDKAFHGPVAWVPIGPEEVVVVSMKYDKPHYTVYVHKEKGEWIEKWWLYDIKPGLEISEAHEEEEVYEEKGHVVERGLSLHVEDIGQSYFLTLRKDWVIAVHENESFDAVENEIIKTLDVAKDYVINMPSRAELKQALKKILEKDVEVVWLSSDLYLHKIAEKRVRFSLFLNPQ